MRVLAPLKTKQLLATCVIDKLPIIALASEKSGLHGAAPSEALPPSPAPREPVVKLVGKERWQGDCVPNDGLAVTALVSPPHCIVPRVTTLPSAFAAAKVVPPAGLSVVEGVAEVSTRELGALEFLRSALSPTSPRCRQPLRRRRRSRCQ